MGGRMSHSQLYALLIGIDCYLPGNHRYHNLKGCVRDICLIEEYLIRKLGLTKSYITKLTSTTVVGSTHPKEPEDQWPTYEHMVTALLSLIQVAQKGDQVYIHYSGHGGRVRTKIPARKGQDGLDEALVPLDIGSPKARY